MRSTLSISVAILIGIGSQLGHAASSASASIGPMAVALADLDANDGVVPSFTVSPCPFPNVCSYANVLVYNLQSSETREIRKNGQQTWDALFSSANVTNVSSQAQLSGPGTLVGTSFSASGTTLGVRPLGTYSVFESGTGAQYNQYFPSFILSAKTSIVISAVVQLNATVTATWNPANTFERESAFASSFLRIHGYVNGVFQFSELSHAASAESLQVFDASYPLGYYYTGATNAATYNYQVSFVNNSNEPAEVQFRSYVDITGTSRALALAVPEPARFPLMVAGLIGLLSATKRRSATD